MISWRSTHRWMPDSRIGRVGVLAGSVVVAFIVAVALTALLMDWNAMRGPISRMLAAHFDRPVRIDGNLEVRLLSLTPTVIVRGLDIGNPAWAGAGSMARAERVTLQFKLLPLFKSSLILPSVRIERPVLHLLRDTDGRVNWGTGRKGESRGSGLNLPVIQKFEMQPGEVTFDDRTRELEFRGIVSAYETTAKETAKETARTATRENARPFRLTGLGTMNGQPFRFDVRGAPLVNVRRDRSYPFDLDLVADSTHLTARGVLPKPFDLSFVDADFEMAGGDLADVYYISGIVFPNTRAYHVTGHFARQGPLTRFQKLSGTVGDSDMQGDVSVQLSGTRPLVTARVASQSLDLDDAATWFGARRGSGGASEKETPGEHAAASGRIFPDAKLRVARVRSMDAAVAYEASTVHSDHLPIRALSMNLRMNGGVLTFDPVSLALPEGKIDGTVRLDARGDIARTTLDAQLVGVQLRQFKSKKSTRAPFDGVLRGRVKLEGRGNSVHQFVSASDGTATFVLPHGKVSDSLAELSGINVSRALGLMMKKDEDEANVRCGVADLKATDGKLQVQNLVFDTDNVLITGKGDVRLEDEQYDLTIHGQPKKLRLLRLKSPISIRGPLNKPSLGVEVDRRAVKQAGVAAALGALVTPLAAVVVFVDPGLAKDADCASLLAEAKAAGAPVKTAEIQGAERH